MDTRIVGVNGTRLPGPRLEAFFVVPLFIQQSVGVSCMIYQSELFIQFFYL